MACPGCGAIARSAQRPSRSSRRLESVWLWSRVPIWTSLAPQGECMPVFFGEFDTAESEIKAERVARAARQRAEEGRANGACAYGWRRVYQRDAQGRVLDWVDEIDEPAAEVVRGIVRDLLAGVTLRAITARLNDGRSTAPLGGRVDYFFGSKARRPRPQRRSSAPRSRTAYQASLGADRGRGGPHPGQGAVVRPQAPDPEGGGSYPSAHLRDRTLWGLRRGARGFTEGA